MTHNEVKQVLATVDAMSASMDKAHIKRLFQILIDARKNKCCALFYFMSTRMAVKKLIAECMELTKASKHFSRHQMRAIYEIMGDYKWYPICQLCGQPIKIDTESSMHIKQSQPMAFSWDHIYPKTLGGSNDLSNMQAAHKVCNNQKGDKVLYSEHCTINITIDMNQSCECQQKKHKQKRHRDLRKQDSWCHKHKKQRHR